MNITTGRILRTTMVWGIWHCTRLTMIRIKGLSILAMHTGISAITTLAKVITCRITLMRVGWLGVRILGLKLGVAAGLLVGGLVISMLISMLNLMVLGRTLKGQAALADPAIQSLQLRWRIILFVVIAHCGEALASAPTPY